MHSLLSMLLQVSVAIDPKPIEEKILSQQPNDPSGTFLIIGLFAYGIFISAICLLLIKHLIAKKTEATPPVMPPPARDNDDLIEVNYRIENLEKNMNSGFSNLKEYLTLLFTKVK